MALRNTLSLFEAFAEADDRVPRHAFDLCLIVVLTSRFFMILTPGAEAAEVKMSVGHAHSFTLAQLAPDLRYQGCIKLGHPATAQTGEMVVGTIVHEFIVAVPFAQAMLLHQPHLFENSQRAVHGRQADVGIVRLDQIVQPVGIEMHAALVEHLENQTALGSQSPARRSKDISQIIFPIVHFPPSYCE
jgi:hypothetical protein